MKLCEDNHPEIVFEGNWNTKCPLCLEIEKGKDLQNEVDELKTEIQKLEDRIEEYNEQI